jgi:hypothetical protein
LLDVDHSLPISYCQSSIVNPVPVIEPTFQRSNDCDSDCEIDCDYCNSPQHLAKLLTEKLDRFHHRLKMKNAKGCEICKKQIADISMMDSYVIPYQYCFAIWDKFLTRSDYDQYKRTRYPECVTSMTNGLVLCSDCNILLECRYLDILPDYTIIITELDADALDRYLKLHKLKNKFLWFEQLSTEDQMKYRNLHNTKVQWPVDKMHWYPTPETLEWRLSLPYVKSSEGKKLIQHHIDEAKKRGRFVDEVNLMMNLV